MRGHVLRPSEVTCFSMRSRIRYIGYETCTIQSSAILGSPKWIDWLACRFAQSESLPITGESLIQATFRHSGQAFTPIK
ncbi:uncharacterized protein YALI1_F12052g [Yarrowia lipolytica]|uniref:Uncharacterized protein n=1 Tax=Yarrowia lipolytica TaxID=4952 RepID=A0A1D8NMI6_YARLL|nr:hypothetical protein YALI1_F12052g [Yarrowia lipolytica]